MIHPITRIASFVLAFGFFISCTTLSTSEPPITVPDNLSEDQLQQHIDSLAEEVEHQMEMFLYEADSLMEEATEEDPGNEQLWKNLYHACT